MAEQPTPSRRMYCRHIRSKETFHSTTPHVEDLYHSGIYWCDKTSEGRGPDGAFACLEECMAGRSCFER